MPHEQPGFLQCCADPRSHLDFRLDPTQSDPQRGGPGIETVGGQFISERTIHLTQTFRLLDSGDHIFRNEGNGTRLSLRAHGLRNPEVDLGRQWGNGLLSQKRQSGSGLKRSQKFDG